MATHPPHSAPPPKPQLAEVLSLICDLSNHVAQKDALEKLRKIWQEDAARAEGEKWLADPSLYQLAHDLLARYPFRRDARRFIHDLIEPSLRAALNSEGQLQSMRMSCHVPHTRKLCTEK